MKQIMFDENAMNLFMSSRNGDLKKLYILVEFFAWIIKKPVKVFKFFDQFGIETWDELYVQFISNFFE